MLLSIRSLTNFFFSPGGGTAIGLEKPRSRPPELSTNLGMGTGFGIFSAISLSCSGVNTVPEARSYPAPFESFMNASRAISDSS